MAGDFSITVDGVNELLLKLSSENLSRVSEDFCQEVADTVPQPILSAMQEGCPEETGELRNAFEAAVEETVHGISVQVGPNDAIHTKSKLPNSILAGVFEWGGKVGSWIRNESGFRKTKRRHKRRTQGSHELNDTIQGTFFMQNAWQQVSRETLDRVVGAAKRHLVDGLES